MIRRVIVTRISLLAVALLLTFSGVICFQTASEDRYLGTTAMVGQSLIGMGAFFLDRPDGLVHSRSMARGDEREMIAWCCRVVISRLDRTVSHCRQLPGLFLALINRQKRAGWQLRGFHKVGG